MSTEPQNKGEPSKRRGCSRKGCGFFLLLAIPLLLTLYFLFVVIENWRGVRAWERAVVAAEAAGEQLDLLAVLAQQPEIADEENFAAIPLLDSLVDFTLEYPTREDDELWGGSGEQVYHQVEERERFLQMHLPKLNKKNKPPSASWPRAEPRDLAAWHTALVAEGSMNLSKGEKPSADLLKAIDEQAGEIIEELAEATKRPQGRFKQHQPMKGFLDAISFSVPHCNECTKAVNLLNLHATAAIAHGDGETALRSTRVALRLGEATGSANHLIGTLVEMTIYQIITNAIWEGLRAEIWNDAQLAELESLLARPNLLATAYPAMQGEAAMFTGSFRAFAHRVQIKDLSSLGLLIEDLGYSAPLGSPFLCLIPRGWIDQNCALTTHLHLKHNLIPLRERDVTTLLNQPPPIEKLAVLSPYNFFTRKAFPIYSGLPQRYIFTDSLLAMIRNACRLEQHKLRTGGYPDELKALGDDLPKDLFNDAPFHYTRTDDGRYKLWSIGINQEDDAGRIALKADGKYIDREQGDLVWAYRPEDLLPEVE